MIKNNFALNKKILFIILSIFVLSLSSCDKVPEESYNRITNAVSKTNSEEIYKASFVLEVKNTDKQELVMFVQGSYSIDKSKTNSDGVLMNGELVQTVYNTPSSLKMAFYDNTYVTITDDYKILSDMDESMLLKQFMCSPAISFPLDKIVSIDESKVSGGVMYTVKANKDTKEYLEDLLGDDLYSFSGMKQAQKELTEYSDVYCKYVISDEGIISNRETSYTVTAYDIVPYFPGVQATNEDYKYTFSVSLKINYKAFREDVNVDITDFLPDKNSSEES